MQYRLSTLFLLTAVVAASLAAFGAWGIGSPLILLLSAAFVHYGYRLRSCILWGTLVFVLFHSCLLSIQVMYYMQDAEKTAECHNNFIQIGLGLLCYQDANSHFPPAVVCDARGNPLRSWRFEISYFICYGNILNECDLKQAWDSPRNSSFTKGNKIEAFTCPLHFPRTKLGLTSALAIIGPGTAWRADRPVKLSELPDEGSHTVSVVEVASEEVYWAEPRDLTVEEALEGLKTGKGLRISSFHPDSINILFADGTPHTFPSRMPLEFWEKLLAAEIENPEKYALDGEAVSYPNPTGSPEVETSLNPYNPFLQRMQILLSFVIWLVLSVWFLIRAAKSRPCEEKIPLEAISSESP